jgi:hypothetical protein
MRWLFAMVAAGCVLIGSGCAGPASYRYSNHILVPPGVKNASVVERTVTIPITAKCSSSEDGLRMERHGRTIRVTVQTKPLLAHPAGWLSAFGTGLEKKGCVEIGEGSMLAARVAELLPADPRAVAALLHPSAAIAGYVDLGTEHRLKVVGPILKEGAQPGASAIGSPETSGTGGKLTVEMHASKDFIGYETAWFAMQAIAGKPGATIAFLSAQDTLDGKSSPANKPRLDYFQFAPDAAFYRLFYLTRISQADHDIAVLAAPTKAALEERTARFAADPAICGTTARGWCVLIPRESAVVPHILVTACGAEIAVVAGGTVHDALRAAGVTQPASVLAALQVQRRFAGKLVPVIFRRDQQEILDLPLAGGEDIRW